MRIASLLPSATEIVCALGLRGDLVAITHECDYPPGLERVPVITSSVLSGPGSSIQIDRHIRELVHGGNSIYHLDAERLQALKPDLILTQELCEVCAVSYPIVQSAARRLEGPVRLVSLEPATLGDVFKNIELVGELTDRRAAGKQLVEELSQRVARLRDRLRGRPRPRVLCLEWIDPPFNAGHWTPGLVELAGGIDPLGAPGRPAVPLDWEKVKATESEVVVVMACGLTLERSLEEAAPVAARLAGRETWVVDGNAYFSRPGPRLVDSAEVMGRHPSPPGRTESLAGYGAEIVLTAAEEAEEGGRQQDQPDTSAEEEEKPNQYEADHPSEGEAELLFLRRNFRSLIAHPVLDPERRPRPGSSG